MNIIIKYINNLFLSKFIILKLLTFLSWIIKRIIFKLFFIIQYKKQNKIRLKRKTLNK